jgi:UDP-GlcNAc:undecaprenyl-phosphate GlcNAc-1-phosphate transferase
VSRAETVRILLAFTTSVALSAGLTPLARSYALRSGLIAKPKTDRWHRKPTALLGGPAIALPVVTTIMAFVDLAGHPLLLLWLLGAILISAVGLYDDVRGLRPSSKLIAQIVVALLAVSAGLRIPVFHPIVSFLLAVFWIVGMTNAFNLLDNMDGLAAGIAAIAAAVLGLHALRSGDLTIAASAAALAGGSLGFLVYNFQPASIFMGDGGSLFLGYSLGTLSLMNMNARPIASLSVIAVPFFLLAVPIFDTTLVTVLRVLNGRSIAQGGRDHSSHRLVSLGLSERSAVLALYVISAATGALSLLLPRFPAYLVVLSLLVAVLVIYYFGLTLGSVAVYQKEPAGVPRARTSGVFVLDTFIQHKQRIMDVTVDATVIVISYLAAYLLRYEGTLSERNLQIILTSLPILIAVRLGSLWVFGLYRTMPGVFSIHDFLAVFKAIFISSTIFVTALVLFTRFKDFSRAVIVIDAILSLTGIVFARIALHSLKTLLRGLDGTDRPGLLIVGAGPLGEAATRLLEAEESGRHRIVGFLDDSPEKAGRSLHGYMVLGSIRDADRVLSGGGIATVVFASSKISVEDRDRLKDTCRRLSLEIREVILR